MAITREEVLYVARLARLSLPEAEADRLREQLSAILDYAARLSQIDTSAISPTASLSPFPSPLRPDVIQPSLPRARVLANAPSAEDGLFRVPPVLES